VRRRPEIMFDGNLKREALVVVTLKHAKLNWGHVRPNARWLSLINNENCTGSGCLDTL
jgi:hypothetical protein